MNNVDEVLIGVTAMEVLKRSTVKCVVVCAMQLDEKRPAQTSRENEGLKYY